VHCVQVLVGELPADFLRVTSSAEQQQIAADRQTAAYLQSGGMMPVFAPASRLSITIAQVVSALNCEWFHRYVVFSKLYALIAAAIKITCNAIRIIVVTPSAFIYCTTSAATATAATLNNVLG